jgi:hypothetical protein
LRAIFVRLDARIPGEFGYAVSEAVGGSLRSPYCVESTGIDSEDWEKFIDG